MSLDRTGWTELETGEHEEHLIQQILDLLKDESPEVSGFVISNAIARKIKQYNIDPDFSIEWISEETAMAFVQLEKNG
jgi:hypothetical protein